ncbi:hypothetical protein T265_00192 [Opisthorchis viverrini]|uniref:Rab-GAP TBC domain-containing protein n=1 Tax=Opisthorchis viverrini TaxID=6198 RepID=A0A075A2Q1_OPIVI|nr:hypothetical protein T265_00192 [Opisthorchis viverrini]KER33993.1 hypothetical protein T265_00192 [Opisthorchis viverrini]
MAQRGGTRDSLPHTFKYDPYGTDLKQWKNVYITHIVNSNEYPGVGLKGTLFLTEHETKVLIHWVPDPDQDDSVPPDLKKGYEIDVQDLKQLMCRRLPGFRYRALYLFMKDTSRYGPFEFRTGGATEFIGTLDHLTELTRSDNDKTMYYIKPRTVPTFNSVYQLPTGSGQTRPLFSASAVSVGASLRMLGKKVSGPMNTVLETILTPSGVITGEPVGVNGTGYANPYLGQVRGTPHADRLRTTDDNDFAVVDVRPSPIKLPALPEVHRSDPLNFERWKRHLDPYGRVTCVEKLRKIIFEGGIEPSLRPIVWKYLLGYYLWNNTAEENEKLRKEKHAEYHTVKRFWKEMSNERLLRFSVFRDRKCYIDKDVPRTDRKTAFYRDDSSGNLTKLHDILVTYSIYNMDFGYFQGMNDLLALILYVIQQEEDAFWCFAGLMERLESNFDGNLKAVREQFTQLFELIETIWSEYLTKNFHIFFAAAVLLMQRKVFMDRNYDANSILKHVNELSFNITLEPALNCATAYILQLDQVINLLTPAVRAIIQGPSLSTSVHCAHHKTGSASLLEDTSPKLDCTWGLLNEELEDLMASDVPEPTSSEPPPSLMIPIPPCTSSKPFHLPIDEQQPSAPNSFV